MSEYDWNQLGYQWAKHLDINWYHAMADIDAFRKDLGDEKALTTIQAHLSK